MVEFEVKSKKQTIGKKKGQTVYYAVPKSNQHMTLDALCDMIMDETSLSRGDVMNTLITLGKMACRSLKMGASIDLGDLGSLRVYFPPKMMDNMKDVTAATLKTPKIIFTPKAKCVKLHMLQRCLWIILLERKAPPPPPNRKERGVKNTLDHRQGKAPPPKESLPKPLRRRGCPYWI